MVLNNLCSSIGERRRRMGVSKYNKYQRYLEERHAEDEKVLKTDHDTRLDEMEFIERRQQKIDQWLATASITLNVVMIVAKMAAAYLSSSLAIISTLVESAIDVTSGAVVYLCVRLIRKTNRYEYPVGRNRLEPLSVVIVSTAMIMANLFVIAQSVMSIIGHTVNPVMNIETIAILATGTILKAVLFFFCRRHNSPGSRVLAMDHSNDMITNLVALGCAYIGHKWWLYADPLGAFLVCVFVSIRWGDSARQQIPLLIGKAAKPEFINRIIKISMAHDEHIRFIDTVMVYHFGAKFLVELHVVLERDMTLQEAHDISEPLQLKLERLPYVERAFVHCDYSFDDGEHI